MYIKSLLCGVLELVTNYICVCVCFILYTFFLTQLHRRNLYLFSHLEVFFLQWISINFYTQFHIWPFSIWNLWNGSYVSLVLNKFWLLIETECCLSNLRKWLKVMDISVQYLWRILNVKQLEAKEAFWQMWAFLKTF